MNMNLTFKNGINMTLNMTTPGVKGNTGNSVESISLDETTGDVTVKIENSDAEVIGNLNASQTAIYQDTVTAKNTAETKANEASTYADNAGGYATSAGISATQATTQATMATEQATIATTQATNAISIAKTYRQNSTAYAVNDIVLGATNLSKAYFLKCTTAGTTSSSTISTWSAVGSTTTDGTVVWTTKNVLDTTLAGHGITDAPTTSTMTTAIANSSPYCLALPHGAGLFNFSITNGTGVAWKLSNGVLSTSTTQNLTLPAGTSYLYCNNLWASGVQVSAGSTGSKFTGDLSSLSNLTYYLSLYNCSLVTGSLSSLSNLTYYLSLYGCSLVTGSLSGVSNLTYYLNLYNCSLVTGNLSSVSNLTYLLNLGNCSLVTGSLSSVSNLTYYLNLGTCSLVTGDLSSLSNLTYYLNLNNCSLVTGDLSSLSNLTYTLNLGNCSLITGSLGSLGNLTYLLNLNNCSLVTGVLSPKATLSYIDISYTGVSSADLDTSISNLNTITTVTKGTLKLSGLTRSSASTTAINALITKGWSVTDATVVG